MTGCGYVLADLGWWQMRCNQPATDAIDNADGSSSPVCPEHGGRQ